MRRGYPSFSAARGSALQASPKGITGICLRIAVWPGHIPRTRGTQSKEQRKCPKSAPQLPFVIFASSCANFLGLLLSPTLRIHLSLRDAFWPAPKSTGAKHVPATSSLRARDLPFRGGGRFG